MVEGNPILRNSIFLVRNSIFKTVAPSSQRTAAIILFKITSLPGNIKAIPCRRSVGTALLTKYYDGVCRKKSMGALETEPDHDAKKRPTWIGTLARFGVPTALAGGYYFLLQPEWTSTVVTFIVSLIASFFEFFWGFIQKVFKRVGEQLRSVGWKQDLAGFAPPTWRQTQNGLHWVKRKTCQVFF